MVCGWSKSLRAQDEMEEEGGLACLGIELGGEGAVARSGDLHVKVTRAARIHAGEAGLLSEKTTTLFQRRYLSLDSV